MRGQVRRWGVPLVLVASTTALGGGCGLVLNYGDLGGTGGAAASAGSTGSTTTSGTGGGSTASTGSGGTGGGGGMSASSGGGPSSSSGATSSSGGVACSGTCLPPIPGWLLVLFHEGAGALPSCQKTVAFGGIDPIGAPATCSACGCGTPTCTAPLQVELWTSDATCATNASDVVDANATGCAGFPSTTVALKIPEPNGTAPTTGGVATLSPATWAVNYETCSPTIQPGTCPSTETCLAPAPVGFSACLTTAAAASPVTCPVAGYTQHVFATSITDTRACGCQCKCGACTGGTWQYTTACPGTAGGSMIPLGTCASAPTKDFLVVDAPPKAPASCTSDTVGPTGGVAAGPSVVTVCCPP